MKTCIECGKELLGRQRKFCSTNCEKNNVTVRSRELYKDRLRTKVCKHCGSEFQGTDKQTNCSLCKRKRKPEFKSTHKIITVCPDCNAEWRIEEKYNWFGLLYPLSQKS